MGKKYRFTAPGVEAREPVVEREPVVVPDVKLCLLHGMDGACAKTRQRRAEILREWIVKYSDAKPGGRLAQQVARYKRELVEMGGVGDAGVLGGD